MAMKSQHQEFSIFCTICKRHVTVKAESLKDAERKFRAQGHDKIKVRKLRKGLVGYYETAAQLERKQEEAKKRKSAKEIEEVIHES